MALEGTPPPGDVLRKHVWRFTPNSSGKALKTTDYMKAGVRDVTVIFNGISALTRSFPIHLLPKVSFY